MYQSTRHQLNDTTPCRLMGEGACMVQVTSGRLWLTVEGREIDHFVAAGERLSLPAGGAVWVSGDPIATFTVVRHQADRAPRPGRAAGAAPAEGLMALVERADAMVRGWFGRRQPQS